MGFLTVPLKMRWFEVYLGTETELFALYGGGACVCKVQNSTGKDPSFIATKIIDVICIFKV